MGVEYLEGVGTVSVSESPEYMERKGSQCTWKVKGQIDASCGGCGSRCLKCVPKGACRRQYGGHRVPKKICVVREASRKVRSLARVFTVPRRGLECNEGGWKNIRDSVHNRGQRVLNMIETNQQFPYPNPLYPRKRPSHWLIETSD